MWIEVFLAFFIIYVIWTTAKKPSNYPPGPWGLPFIGSIPFSIGKIESKISKLKKEHGSVFCWRIGSRLFVFLTEFKLVKEVMKNPVYANRPTGITSISILEGVISTNGFHWSNTRKFMKRHLRDLGLGKSKIVLAIQHEASELVKVMKKQAGQAAPIPKALAPAVINVLWQIMASKRYDLDDALLIDFNNIIHQVILENMIYSTIGDIFSWAENYLPKVLWNKITRRDIQIDLSRRLKEYFKICIDDHIKTIDRENPRDFIDEYLTEMEKQESNPQSTMSYDDLVLCIGDLFQAGLEANTIAIIWSIFYLATFPEIQSKIYKEIDDTFSKDTLVTFEDKSRVPYTDAFIQEVLRFSSIATLGGAYHTSFEDTTIGGYTIPKNSVILVTLGEIHYDPKIFDSPKEFRPERFLNSEGKLEIPKEGYFPFGVGKRKCIGESMARMELFIFIVTMLQQLKFSVPPNKKLDLRPMDMPLIHSPRYEEDVLITIRK